MIYGKRADRRRGPRSALALERSFLFHVPHRLAWPMLLALLAATASAQALAPQEIWFGPAYLVAIAFAAWSIGTGFAIGLGLAVLGAQLAIGDLSIHPHGSSFVVSNVVVRVLGLSIVIGIIGLARKSCEREWRLARTDQLTGALNRQAFFEVVRNDDCSGGWSALIFADLDGLKRMNDAQGHDRGDRCLRTFSEVVRKTIRKNDIFARMGGDEFAIFMKLKDQESGLAVARRLHQAVNLRAGECCDNSLQCSFGVLLLPTGSTSIDAELKAVDELMYMAKAQRAGVYLATAIGSANGLVMSSPIAVVDTPHAEPGLTPAAPEDALAADTPPKSRLRSIPRAAA